MDRVLVVGATGRVGREVVHQLPVAGVWVRALVRDAEKASLPAHVEVFEGDLTRPETLDACIDDVDALFLVWTAPPDAVGATLDRIVTRARRVVFLSSPYKTAHPFFQAAMPNPIAELHAEIERRIEASGCQWTFLRPGMIAANALWWWAPQIRDGGDIVRWPCLEAATAPVDERDIAAVAVRALCEGGHDRGEYVLTGPESLTQRKQISIIGDAVGRSLQIEETAGMPGEIGVMLVTAWRAAVGCPALVTSTVEELTGRPARTFREWAVDHAAGFQPSGRPISQ